MHTTNLNRLLCAATLLLYGGIMSARANAGLCSPTGQTVVRTMNNKVAVYSADGAYLKDINAVLIATGRPILACDESNAHIQVTLTTGDSVWVDRLDVEIAGALTSTPRPCKNRSIAKPGDQTAPATSGIDPCTQ